MFWTLALIVLAAERFSKTGHLLESSKQDITAPDGSVEKFIGARGINC